MGVSYPFTGKVFNGRSEMSEKNNELTFDGKIDLLQKYIDESERIVFFGGAGVSTESGIPDFRSKDGLYNQKYDYPPEKIISRSFFEQNPEVFYKFYRDKLVVSGVKPNITHEYLSKLERSGKLSAVVTQNIDGLHQAAGSKNVYELHGSLLRNYCSACRKKYSIEEILSHTGIPRCGCGGVIRPDIVLYEEPLDDDVTSAAIEKIMDADMLLIAGTSLTVYPAAYYVRYFCGERLVIINRDETPFDDRASLVIHSSLGDVISNLRLP